MDDTTNPEPDTLAEDGETQPPQYAYFLPLLRLTDTGAHFGIDRTPYHGPQVPRGGISYDIFPTFRGDDPKVRIGRDHWVELGRPGEIEVVIRPL